VLHSAGLCTEGSATDLHELPGLAGLRAQRPQLPPRQLAAPEALRGDDAPPVPQEVGPRRVAPPRRLDRQRRAVLPAYARGPPLAKRWPTQTALPACGSCLSTEEAVADGAVQAACLMWLWVHGFCWQWACAGDGRSVDTLLGCMSD